MKSFGFLHFEEFDLNGKKAGLLLVFLLLAVLTLNANTSSGLRCPELGCLCGESGENFSGEIDCVECEDDFILHLGLGYFTYDCDVTRVEVCEEGDKIDEYYREDGCEINFQFINF